MRKKDITCATRKKQQLLKDKMPSMMAKTRRGAVLDALHISASYMDVYYEFPKMSTIY